MTNNQTDETNISVVVKNKMTTLTEILSALKEHKSYHLQFVITIVENNSEGASLVVLVCEKGVCWVVTNKIIVFIPLAASSAIFLYFCYLYFCDSFDMI